MAVEWRPPGRTAAMWPKNPQEAGGAEADGPGARGHISGPSRGYGFTPSKTACSLSCYIGDRLPATTISFGRKPRT
jgi:hypothetical protein